MSFSLADFWTGVRDALLRRPTSRQVAALCWRRRAGETEVLLITSRGSGRWILPKGWPVPGQSDARSALTEAWEEAGVRTAAAVGAPLGRYVYFKNPGGRGKRQPTVIEATVFPIEVDRLADKYPEAGQRRRMWVPPDQAAVLVDEPELQALLRNM